ncbi:hypothetical protein [Brevibacterium aurantiacum]|uniref:hypothetical protein n=1 Tax=Brevibacterium aurantiacum TaxID=273384 RepID=UPI0011C01BBE|nr:hypothetical protein [Brevibacterium aurantiacum]
MLTHLYVRLVAFVAGVGTADPKRRGDGPVHKEVPDRRDVPGWVLITLVSFRAHTFPSPQSQPN